jgi:Mrp family chromosome partitioning ATPase
MTRIYSALKTQGDPLPPSDQKVATHDLGQFQESGAKLGLNGNAPRRHRLPPLPPLTREARDQVVNLVDRVFLFTNSSTPKIVAFSNVDKGSSSSGMCLHAAQVLAARVSGEVCLVNANGEESLLHRLGPRDGSPGLADAIDSSAPIRDFAVQAEGGNLWFLPAGSRRDGSFHFSPDRLRGRMMELRRQFDYILIEAPSATAVSTILIGQMADGVVMVVEAHSTRRETARIAKETLEAAHVTLLGAVLNNRTFPIPEALYRKL